MSQSLVKQKEAPSDVAVMGIKTSLCTLMLTVLAQDHFYSDYCCLYKTTNASQMTMMMTVVIAQVDCSLRCRMAFAELRIYLVWVMPSEWLNAATQRSFIEPTCRDCAGLPQNPGPNTRAIEQEIRR